MRHHYTTWGSVRGTCGHKHRTIEAALACIYRDSVGCTRQGGYSDRHVRNENLTHLSPSDTDALRAILEADDDPR